MRVKDPSKKRASNIDFVLELLKATGMIKEAYQSDWNVWENYIIVHYIIITFRTSSKRESKGQSGYTRRSYEKKKIGHDLRAYLRATV